MTDHIGDINEKVVRDALATFTVWRTNDDAGDFDLLAWACDIEDHMTYLLDAQERCKGLEGDLARDQWALHAAQERCKALEADLAAHADTIRLQDERHDEMKAERDALKADLARLRGLLLALRSVTQYADGTALLDADAETWAAIQKEAQS